VKKTEFGKFSEENYDGCGVKNSADKMKYGVITKKTGIATEKFVALDVCNKDWPKFAQDYADEKNNNRYSQSYIKNEILSLVFWNFHFIC